MAASDVLGTGWYAADAAQAGPGKTIVVVGDGAVGLSAVIGAKQLGAEKIIIMSRNPERQALAKAFGATHIVEERGEEGIAKVMELTDGVGAHGVTEAVGTQQSFDQALGCVRHGGYIGFWVYRTIAPSAPMRSSASRFTWKVAPPPYASTCRPSST